MMRNPGVFKTCYKLYTQLENCGTGKDVIRHDGEPAFSDLSMRDFLILEVSMNVFH